MLAYHNDAAIKSGILAQLAAHRSADELLKGKYWENGKGCAIGCTIHSGNHIEYEFRFGIPQMLAHLEDCIFEGLPAAEAAAWPERFMGAIRPGADLSLVGWKFLTCLLTDASVNPGIEHPLVRSAVAACAKILAAGPPFNVIEAKIASRGALVAACAAWHVAASASFSASSALYAARAFSYAVRDEARSAAYAARGAAFSALSAASSALSAAGDAAVSAAGNAAFSAAMTGSSAANPARDAAWIKMADRLVQLAGEVE